MKKLLRFIAVIMVCTIIISVTGVSAYCAEELDLGRQGSLTVDFRDSKTGKPIVGGTLEVYKIASAVNTGSGYQFKTCGSFTGCNLDLTTLESPSLAFFANLYATVNGIAPDKVTYIATGSAVFTGLEPGVYVCRQTDAAFGYQPITPFAVSIPLWLGDEFGYLYDINATPKTEPSERVPVGPWDPPSESDNPPHEPDEPEEIEIPPEEPTPSEEPTPPDETDEKTPARPENPTTGDDTPLALWIGALLVSASGAALIILVIVKRKKDSKEQ